LVLARPNADPPALAAVTQKLGNVTILVRPIGVAALVSAVQTALRARKRQYQIRQHLVERAQAEEQLRINDQRKDEFLAILAHELRNPLAPVSNALHLLQHGLAGQHRALGLVQMMERQVGNLTRLVNDLLEVSRVTRGELDLHCEPVDLATLVSTAVESSQPLITAAGHRLHLSLPPFPVRLHADPVRLAQVISNLLNNAAKYTPDGGTIRLTVRHEGAEVCIEVQDNGIGISAEDRQNIFELFMQVQQNRERSQGGLGIGLTLVKRLVELHGGRISVESEGFQKGSRFIVCLPAEQQDESLPATAALSPAWNLSHLEILVADDNRDAADSLGTLLQQFGAQVTIAYDGQSALDAFRSRTFGAAILDIGMPDIDGHQVARRIRAEHGRQTVLLLALTGWGQQEDIRKTAAAGFDHHLTKPVDFSVLLAYLCRNGARDRPRSAGAALPEAPSPSR
ncbi:MAG TPA: ATP-binding protein, partial [Solimonas sp.]